MAYFLEQENQVLKEEMAIMQAKIDEQLRKLGWMN